MEGTSSTPHLLTDVRFTVSRKGYDPDEVDNFLERVSSAVAQLQDKLRQATAQAEDAEARFGESARNQGVLQTRVATLEAELASVPEGGSDVGSAPRRPEDDAEQVSKVLVLAQRTADAAIEEATATATTTLAEARTRASALVTEAEQESARLVTSARAEADELVGQQRASLADEIRGLETVRDSIAADVTALEWHVGEQRSVVQGSITRVQAVLDDPAVFRVAPAPHLGGSTLSDVMPDPPDVASYGPEAAEVVETAAEPTSVPVTAEEDSAVASGDEDAELAPLFHEDADSGPPTQAHLPVESDQDSPLGPPDDEADAAMKAFFEAEFDDDPGRSPR